VRIAAIDIGTNSLHMLIVQVRADLSFEVIDREKAMVRLGAGGLSGRRLTRASMTAALEALRRFRRLVDARQVDEVLAAATSATREALNGSEFLAQVTRATGFRPRVISGEQEARLIHQAAVHGVHVGRGRAAVIDIGGGSMEVTLGTGAAVHLARSFKLGVIRMTERFVKTDPLDARDEARLEDVVRGAVGDYCGQVAEAGFDRVIGTSGTILSLGTMAAALDRGQAPKELRNLSVTARQIRRLRKELTDSTLEGRLALPGMDARRSDLIVAGAVVLDTTLGLLGASELTLCDLALREGLLLDYIRRHRREIAQADAIPDVRRRSTIELAERCGYQADHSIHVARLALALFDQSRAVHELTDREREWLEYAALLHDIGVHISYARHHKHSHYLITNGDLRGFHPDEIAVIALVARYHRRGTPKRTHPEWSALDASHRKAVRVLAAILRLAESLDRSHAQVVTGLTLTRSGKAYTLTCKSSADAEVEVWAAQRHSEPFSRLLGAPCAIEAAQPSAPGATASGRARVTRN
jgi:exopolyphosphatase/guanosine-5'-triphosphate,3'-diphosphate pyrophosphatase